MAIPALHLRYDCDGFGAIHRCSSLLGADKTVHAAGLPTNALQIPGLELSRSSSISCWNTPKLSLDIYVDFYTKAQ